MSREEKKPESLHGDEASVSTDGKARDHALGATDPNVEMYAENYPDGDPKVADPLIAEDKNADLATSTERRDGTFLTTNDGVRVATTNNSLRAGERGPLLHEDFHFREKMSHFDFERIPERVVHARGTAAFGVFKPYESAADITSAAFLQDPSVETPVFTRFSTVAGFRGSADNVRDVRGFAVKFYTSEGNFDLVGNNMPVFFIQDAMKFPDFVHSVKPEQDNEMPQAASAHDTFWDFISLQHEATHMVMWAMSDRAIPRSLRTMEGFGVHTFRMINAEGKSSFVKFHWKPLQGLRSNVWDEQQKIAGKNADFNREELWTAIEDGHFPEWELGVQVIPEEDEFSFDFDILDPTKIIPEERVPIRKLGKMTLNRNPQNFFAEVEQSAFHPGRFVPGIAASHDPLLQGRLFSYMDTQIHRLGGPNFTQLPVNRPLAQVHNQQRDGQHQMRVHAGKANYYPNSVDGGAPSVASPAQGAYMHYPEPMHGMKNDLRADSFKDHYSHATMFWNSLTDAEKDHEVDAFVFELSKVKTVAIRERVVEQFNHVDHELATRIADGLGLDRPTEEFPNHGKSSDALSIDKRERISIGHMKVAALVADGFDAAQVDALNARLAPEDAHLVLVGPTPAAVKDSSGNKVQPDFSYQNGASVFYDAIVVIGGAESAEKLATIGHTMSWLNEAYAHYKPIAVLGEASRVLEKTQVPAGAPGVFVGNDVAADLVNALYTGRFWDRDVDGIPH